jgi:nicotinate-nucleotide pyrophosphorylase (carboxylating)
VVEASGNVGLQTLNAIAGTGVDVISCGALTHQAVSVDLSMRIPMD